uniref:Cullin family profile domain-containing protein n=1 Tax=Fundulus heteroclitus TaxID=8078 RepID=A0A3Q2QI35_FUNHE
PDFVERYRTLYLRLKNAMEELFGQQTAFVLALRHGFSAALLQLSILRAMHVCERFAQYIDQKIQASGSPSGGAETLEQLQQFLEPMLFLSGLELANTFEHFYRYELLWPRGGGGPTQKLLQGNLQTILTKSPAAAELTQLLSASAGQSMYSLSHSKPRRLQWTWLGHAELQFGSWTLHVSTLQMFILLQFNSQEEVAVEALLQESGLSAAVLVHAVQPLISEGGPLTCSPGDDLSRGAGFIPCPPPPSWVPPPQTYLNVDEDAVGTLERKRNFVYCLIVHIMKQEKEMHIDNLVFKVRRRRAPPPPSVSSRSPGGGRFGCSTGDVLSCIMHVINRGCVRRNDDNPHIVEFVPEDPSTPQKGHAQFSFSRSDSGKDAAAMDSKADIRCDRDSESRTHSV